MAGMGRDRLPATETTAGSGGLFGRIGAVVVRVPLLVIAAWIALGLGLTQLFPPLGELAQRAPAAILPDDAPSVVSGKQMTEAFQEASSENILMVVLVNEDGLTTADEEVYSVLVDRLRADTESVAALQDFISTPGNWAPQRPAPRPNR